LERVANLEKHLKEEREKNEKLNHQLEEIGNVLVLLEHKHLEVQLLKAEVKDYQ
jgi:hypothetical protein